MMRIETETATSGRVNGRRPVLLGVVLGVLAMVGASAHIEPARADLRAGLQSGLQTEPRTDADAALPEGFTLPRERRLTLDRTRQLVLAGDGTALMVWDVPERRVISRYPLSPVRSGASLTRLPSGRVLLWGGSDAQGVLSVGGLRFDPGLNVLEPVARSPLSARSRHTATVLSDGRVLFAGGRSARGQSELWDERDDRLLSAV
jgi:hypothetical protein